MLSRPQRRRNKRLYGEEMVYCIPATETVTLDKEFWTYPNGMIPKNFWSMFDNKGNYVKRAEVEGTTSLYQIVPYITVVNKDKKILAHIHKPTGKISLGFSKHIGPDNGNKEVLARSCMEILIENRLATYTSIKTDKHDFKGFIKTFTEETKGHIGVFFVKTIPNLKIEEDINFEYRYMTIEELMDSYGNLEKWARIVLNYFYEEKLRLEGEGK